MRTYIAHLMASVAFVAALIWPSAVHAQDTFTGKVRINSTAADALCVGSSSGASPTCTGGVKAGAGTFASDVTVSGAILASHAETNTVYAGSGAGATLIGKDGYWAIRQSTDHAFNLDMYNSGTPKQAVRVYPTGGVILAGGGVGGITGDPGAGNLNALGVYTDLVYMGGTSIDGSGVTSPTGSFSLGVTTLQVTASDSVPLYADSVGSSAGTTAVWTTSGGHTYLQKQTSSARFKEHITPFVATRAQLASFLTLTPRHWDYQGQATGAVGLLAEDLAAVPIRNEYGMSPLVNYDAQGRPESNRDFGVIAVQQLVLRDHDARLSALEAEMLALQGAR